MPEGQGGETVFPELNVTVRPKRNNLLIWPNFLSGDKIDPKVVHKAERIESGKKIVINIWTRSPDEDEDEDDEDYEVS